MTNYDDDLLPKVVEELDSNISIRNREAFRKVNDHIYQWREAKPGLIPSNEVKWEQIAWRMRAVSRKRREENPDERFRTIISELPPEKQAINYFRQRIENTPNPVRKARYADIVWVTLKQQRGPDHYRYGIEAAEAYLTQVPICVNQSGHIELADGLDRAAEKEEIDEIMTLLDVEPDQLFDQLRSMPFLLPDIDDIKQRASEASEKYLFTQLLGTISLRDGRKVDEIQAGEGDTAHFLSSLNNWFQIYSQLLDIILHRLREEDRFISDSFMAHLRQWELLDEADVPFIEVGLERYFANDFISALHVLTPRIEHMLKSAFERSGLPPIDSKRK